MTALTFSTVGALGAHYMLAAFERERVRDVFSRFVPEQVVDQVLSQAGSDLRLVGKEVVGTVMFSDLRGFTSSAEEMPAADVIQVLNHYLHEMSEAILAHGGTLLCYMGDGIYALFGAPVEQDDHADRALTAAREMLTERLPEFNGWMREQGFGEGYLMGIGLNTGPVMTGNVGHARRMDYTAVGDVTNTASRIEGMTKETPFSVLIAESTIQGLSQPPDGSRLLRRAPRPRPPRHAQAVGARHPQARRRVRSGHRAPDDPGGCAGASRRRASAKRPTSRLLVRRSCGRRTARFPACAHSGRAHPSP